MPTKNIIITGATSMIGEACAKLFVEQGMNVMLVGRSCDKLEALADLLGRDNVDMFVCDVEDTDKLASVAQYTHDKWGRIDGVIQNTSIYPWECIEHLSLSNWEESLHVGLTSVFVLTQACYRLMKVNGQGTMIFMSSLISEQFGLPNMAAYTAAKAGLNGFMRTAALEFASHGITVNSISPGKMYNRSSLSEDEVIKKLKSVPLKRFIPPADVAAMALHLFSDTSRNITGQNFVIDGGQSIVPEDGVVG